MIRFHDFTIDVSKIEGNIPHPISFTIEKMELILKSLFKVAFKLNAQNDKRLKFNFNTYSTPPNTMGTVSISDFIETPLDAGKIITETLPREYSPVSLHGCVIDNNILSSFFFLQSSDFYQDVKPTPSMIYRLEDIINTDYHPDDFKKFITKETSYYHQQFLIHILTIIFDLYPYEETKILKTTRRKLLIKLLTHIDNYINEYKLQSGSIHNYMNTLKEICGIEHEDSLILHGKEITEKFNEQMDISFDMPNDIEIYIDNNLILS